jgi:hypothetical protein
MCGILPADLATVSAFAYIAACRSLDVMSDRHRCHAADAGLDPDAV